MNQVHGEIGEERGLFISFDEVQQEIRVEVRPEGFFSISLVFSVFPHVGCVVAAGALAIPILDPQTMRIESMACWLIRIGLEISQMPFASDSGFVASLLEHLPEGFQMYWQPVLLFRIVWTIEPFQKAGSVGIESS